MAVPRVAVLGGGIGGLSAAIHSRLAGAEVTLVERTRLGGKAAGLETGAYRLDPGPSIVILTEIYRDVFRRAGRPMDDYLRFQRLDPISRVFFGDEPPMDLPADLSACTDLVSGLNHSDGKAFAKLMSKLHRLAPHIEASVFSKPYHEAKQLADGHLLAFGMSFNPWKSYRQLVDTAFTHPLLRAFFYGFPSYGGQSYESKALGALLIPYYMLSQGVFYPEGGVAAIPRAFERLARELGVELLVGAAAVGLDHVGKKVTAVRLESGESIPADVAISNIDRLTTERMLGRMVTARPSYSYFTVHLGIRCRLEGLAHHNLVIPPNFVNGFEELYGRRRPPTDPIVYLNCPSVLDPSTAPPGCTNLFAAVTVPGCEPPLDWAQESERLRNRVIRMIAELGWQIYPDDVDFERIQDPRYFESEHGNYGGSLYGPDEKERLFGGMFPLKCVDDELTNLFYCGGSVQPGAGLPMATLSGKFAVDAARL